MNPTESFWTLQTAMRYGGSFIKVVALAGTKADPVNLKRLLDAFPEIVKQYGPSSILYLRK